MRAKEIFAFVELPKALFEDTPKLRYYTDSPTFQPLPRWLDEVVGRLVIAERLRNTNVDPQTMLALVRDMQLDRLGLLTRDERRSRRAGQGVRSRSAASSRRWC